MEVNRGPADEFERAFGGVSGGGLWRVRMRRDDLKAAASEVLDTLTLAGVAFFQVDDLDTADRFFIRAHGPTSIYESFVNEVRAQLP